MLSKRKNRIKAKPNQSSHNDFFGTLHANIANIGSTSLMLIESTQEVESNISINTPSFANPAPTNIKKGRILCAPTKNY
jgi:hypothetical protein